MARSSKRESTRSVRGNWRDRHGRGIRAAVTGPHLPLLSSRNGNFEMTVASAAQFLKEMWPDELAEARFEIGLMPASSPEGSKVERWHVVPAEKRIILYRLPIERMARLHRDDELHKRMLIESCVFRAVAEYIGKDPWELAPDRFRHF
ncbi:metallopeptidase family protein [Salinibacterium amurskyense]|uniref:metallopeptidase family protein n=1 Tax=Salinibacterium amurskyense TaxID=205941 RepID=UPI000C2484E0|nr:metallopeptidase family protein [Salinibacterium amurskyense]RLQ81619.1 metallopeptidase family protein [Salinibacterium amurskyense]